jgi:hypothetical protein
VYEFEMVLCKSSGCWQGDCCAGCEYNCWKDPERVQQVSLAVRGHERPTETLPSITGS